MLKSARFSRFVFDEAFHTDVIGANGEYVALSVLVGQSFHLLLVGKARNGIDDGFALFLHLAQFQKYRLLFGRRALRHALFAVVSVVAKPRFRTFGKFSQGAVFVFYIAHIRLLDLC